MSKDLTQNPMLSATVITLNEEKNLPLCLESLAFADEIIVIDSGSTDRTVEIAKAFTDRVYQEPWQGYARQKNLAQERAQGPWILNVDADERVTPALSQEILTLLSQKPKEAGFRIPRKNYFRGRWIRHGGWYPNYILRLYRKEAGAFVLREVHEQVMVQGKVGKLKSPLEHFTYESISDYLKRMEIYSELSAAQYFREGKKVTWPGIFFRSFFTFFRMWVLQAGFLDKSDGLVLAVLYSYYTFAKYAKLKERTVRIPRQPPRS